MAKIITTRRRRSAGKVAKKAKAAARRVVVKTKKIYRSAKGVNLSKKDIVVSVAAGGVGAIGSALVLSKLPSTGVFANSKVKNGLVAAAGGFIAYKGMKMKKFPVAAAGIGMAAVAASNIIGDFMPAAATTAAPYINAPRLAAPIMRRPSPVAAPYVRAGKVKTEDYI